MLRSLESQPVSALHGQRFLRDIFGILEPLGLHADVLHKGRVGTMIAGERLLHTADSLPDNDSESVSTAHLMKNFQGRFHVSEAKIHPPGHFAADEACFIAFHNKRKSCGKGDGIDPVSIAIEIHLQHELRIEDTDVGTSGSSFVFRSVHQHTRSLVWPRLEREVVDGVRARHGAAEPTAVRHVLTKPFSPYRRRDVAGFRMTAELVVVGGEQIVLVHDLHQMGRTDATHVALAGVEFQDFLVDACAHFL